MRTCDEHKQPITRGSGRRTWCRHSAVWYVQPELYEQHWERTVCGNHLPVAVREAVDAGTRDPRWPCRVIVTAVTDV